MSPEEVHACFVGYPVRASSALSPRDFAQRMRDIARLFDFAAESDDEGHVIYEPGIDIPDQPLLLGLKELLALRFPFSDEPEREHPRL